MASGRPVFCIKLLSFCLRAMKSMGNSATTEKIVIFGHGEHLQLLIFAARRGLQSALKIVLYSFSAGGLCPPRPPTAALPLDPGLNKRNTG